MAGEPTGRKRGPKGSAIAKYRRDLGIYREWLEGRSAASLARENDLSDRQVREILRQMREVAEHPRDPSPYEVVDRVLLAAEEVLCDLARARDGLTGAARVSALGAYLRGLQRYVDLLGKAGRLPDPERGSIERDIEHTAETILAVFRRYIVPVEARREIRDLLRSKSTSGSTGSTVAKSPGAQRA